MYQRNISSSANGGSQHLAAISNRRKSIWRNLAAGVISANMAKAAAAWLRRLRRGEEKWRLMALASAGSLKSGTVSIINNGV